jgi:hypothetical protein
MACGQDPFQLLQLRRMKEMRKWAEARKENRMKGQRVLGKIKWGVVPAVLALSLSYMFLFHHVRGEQIVDPTEDEYRFAVTRMYRDPITVRSVEEMRDLGAVAWRIVGKAGFSPGSFHVLFLSRLDLREKFHHFIHSPFTGLDSIYADIWFNSCTVYGLSEPTWGIRPSGVYPADKLSALIILIDRLKREKTSLQEHFGAYVEVFSGMELYTLSGRARCWVLLMKQCARDERLADFVERQLELRRIGGIDMAERDLWNTLKKHPDRRTLEALAASVTPTPSPEYGQDIRYRMVFRKMLGEYRH